MVGFQGWIGVDLDGTLAHYDGWKGELHIGTPIQPMVDRIRNWLGEGRLVKIFTARVSHQDGLEEVTVAIHSWLEAAGLPRLELTCTKNYQMIELWDDRCVQVEHNTGLPKWPK